MQGLARAPAHGNSFQQWQADYAARHIPTFPVGADKVPMVSNQSRFGLRASAQIARKYPEAPAIGFMGGRRNGVTVLDIDTTDERVLADALDRHGRTPVIVRTGSGHFHAWYRHAGEGRRVRPRRDVPIDILGGGVVIGPPSRTAKGQYQFLQGSLDDLASLPTLNDAPALMPTENLGQLKNGDGRNNALFRLLGRNAHQVDDFDQLLDYAQTRNLDFGQPLDDKEVVKVAASVWKMQCEGRNRFGQIGSYNPRPVVNTLARTNPNALALLDVLRTAHPPGKVFAIANAMAGTAINLSLYALQRARRLLVELGEVVQVSPDTQHMPAQYRWPLPSERRLPGC
jgi:hypothetical protein